MALQKFSNEAIVRKPDANSGKLLKGLQKAIEEKYHTKIADFWELHKWSIEHLEEFWAELWDYVGIVHSRKYDKVIDLNVPMADSPEWFLGARLNFAENMLKYRDERTALICAGEDRETKKVSFAEMFEETRLYAAAFRKIGLKKGDTVVCYTSNRKEPMFAYQAAISIGAIWTGALPLLGAHAVLNRFTQVNPKILLTIDRFSHNKREIEMLHKVKEIVDGLPSLERVLIVPSKKESKLKDISGIRNSSFLDDFLKIGLDENGEVPPMEFEQVSFSHPVFINFTSGTTGLPKLILHGCGAMMTATRDFWLQMDSDRDSVWLVTFPVGWVSWNMIIPLSFSGVALLLFEGYPFFLSPTSLWDCVDEHKISHIFMATGDLNSLDKLGYVPTVKHDLSSLKVLTVGGSYVKPQTYDFVFNKVKTDILFSSIYGCTETLGTCISVTTTVTVYKGEIPVPCLGMDIQCVDDEGKPSDCKLGNMIIGKPAPTLLLGLLGDVDGSLLRKTYYSKFQGKFAIGDNGSVNPKTKGYIINGRSDDTLKQEGVRFGCSDLYDIVELFPEVRDSLAVTQYNEDLEDRVVIFLKMQNGHIFNDDIVKRIRQAIAGELTNAHVPKVILGTHDLPVNACGKKMEITVKKIINKKPYTTENIMNPECLKNFCDIPELQGF